MIETAAHNGGYLAGCGCGTMASRCSSCLDDDCCCILFRLKDTEDSTLDAVSPLTFQSWVKCAASCRRVRAEAGLAFFAVRYSKTCDAEVGPAGGLRLAAVRGMICCPAGRERTKYAGSEGDVYCVRWAQTRWTGGAGRDSLFVLRSVL